MNRLLLALVLALSLAAASGLRAQSAPTAPADPAAPAQGGEKARARFHELAEKLGLTPEQKEKLEPILKGDFEKLRAIREDTGLSQEEKHSRIKAVFAASRPQIQQILTPDQQGRLRDLMAERKERRAGQET